MEIIQSMIKEITKRINGGIQNPMIVDMNPDLDPVLNVYQNEYVLVNHEEHKHTEIPMISEKIHTTLHQPANRYPSSTSQLSNENFTSWCGTTHYHEFKEIPEEKSVNHLPLKNFLIRNYPWIIDVTEINNTEFLLTKNVRPIEIHLTVSPIHHTELMNPEIEKQVRKKLFEDLVPLISCIYENQRQNPRIIFSPSHSETILQTL
jgi:hypothetical protein